MKRTIIVIGASGTIGAALSNTLEQADHKVIKVSRSSGDYQADITDKSSLDSLFKTIGHFDAVVNAAGEAMALPLEQITDESINLSVNSKMVGQVNLVRAALPY
ncbi:MAG: NAD-dependent epimerase/dehydratase family protein, partial [Flavobacterium sp.]|uniref:NAD-dependent epimerase/dehydratase family protein n=1 Tax=Flavobacterium sp. TaxID=239 RepID=UPI003D0BBE6D